MILSCSDTCSTDTTHTTLTCFLQQSEEKNLLETFSTNKQNISTIILNVCMNMSHDHSQRFICHPNRYLDPLHKHMNSSGNKAEISFEIRGTYFVHPFEEHHFLLVNSKEDNKTSNTFSLKIHPLNISDSIDSPFHKKELKGKNGHISVSLQYELYVPCKLSNALYSPIHKQYILIIFSQQEHIISLKIICLGSKIDYWGSTKSQLKFLFPSQSQTNKKRKQGQRNLVNYPYKLTFRRG
ncbi:hypothetical protein XENTR_v10000467 [Xenopus tropicalis]|nr:hypothetical protein XENTR_v10000467 [Xenopus tropicalis]